MVVFNDKAVDIIMILLLARPAFFVLHLIIAFSVTVS